MTPLFRILLSYVREPFTITLENVPTPKLPKTYIITVTIFDEVDKHFLPVQLLQLVEGFLGIFIQSLSVS